MLVARLVLPSCSIYKAEMTHRAPGVPGRFNLRDNGTLSLPLYFLLGLAVAYSFWGTVGKPNCQDMDFGSYYRAAVAVSHGQTPYTVDEHGPMGVYPYAPVYAYLLSPLHYLDYLWACRCWLVINWAATAVVFCQALGLVLGPDWRFRASRGILLLAAVPTAAYVWANLRVGQAAMLMMLGCLGWAICRRRGRPFLGGLLLAAACAIKLAPLVLVPYLLIQRDRRGLAGVVIGGLSLFMLPAVWVGLAGTVRLHQEWVQHTLATHVPVQTYRPGNQSLLAQLARLPPYSNGHQCYSAENLAALSCCYPLILLVLAAGLYGWILWTCWGRRSSPISEQEKRCDLIHLALLFIFLTLAHPRAWRCNFVALIFPCVLLAEQVWKRRPGFQVSLAALGVVLWACVWPTNGVGEQGWSWGAWLLQGKHFWGAVAVASACYWSRALKRHGLQTAPQRERSGCYPTLRLR